MCKLFVSKRLYLSQLFNRQFFLVIIQDIDLIFQVKCIGGELG